MAATAPAFTYVDVLPSAGSTAPVLLAAFACGHSRPLAQLAKAAGVSRFAAGRALPELLERGLLREDLDGGEGWYEYVPNNPQHELIADMAWRFSGLTRPPEETWVRLDPDDDARYEDEQVRWRYGQLLPSSELIADVIARTGLADGPDLVTARDFTTWAGRAGGRLRQFERYSQQVYGYWTTERFVDMIHQTIHFGGALAKARRDVELSCGARAQGGRDPHQVALPAQIWAQAMFLVSAETARVLDLVRMLDVAITEGIEIHSLRDKAIHDLELVSQRDRGLESRDQYLQEAQEAAAAARHRWQDPPTRYASVGGTPRARDVGTGGDQLMAVQLLDAAQHLAHQVATMADHPSLHPHREAATAEGIDLITDVPESILTENRRR